MRAAPRSPATVIACQSVGSPTSRKGTIEMRMAARQWPTMLEILEVVFIGFGDW